MGLCWYHCTRYVPPAHLPTVGAAPGVRASTGASPPGCNTPSSLQSAATSAPLPVGRERRKELVDGERKAGQDVAQVQQVGPSQVARLRARAEQPNDTAARIGEDRESDALRDEPATACHQSRPRLARRDDLDGDVWRSREVLGDIPVSVARDSLAAVDDEVGHSRYASEDQPGLGEGAEQPTRTRLLADALDQTGLERAVWPHRRHLLGHLAVPVFEGRLLLREAQERLQGQSLRRYRHAGPPRRSRGSILPPLTTPSGWASA